MVDVDAVIGKLTQGLTSTRLASRLDRLENHLESHARATAERAEDHAQRLAAVELKTRELGRPTSRAEDFEADLQSVEARIEELCESQKQDTDALFKRIGNVEAHQQASYSQLAGQEPGLAPPEGAPEAGAGRGGSSSKGLRRLDRGVERGLAVQRRPLREEIRRPATACTTSTQVAGNT